LSGVEVRCLVGKGLVLHPPRLKVDIWTYTVIPGVRSLRTEAGQHKRVTTAVEGVMFAQWRAQTKERERERERGVKERGQREDGGWG